MQELTNEKIMQDFQIDAADSTAAQEVEDIRQAVATAVVTRVTMTSLDEDQRAKVAEMSNDEPEKIHEWLNEQGVDIETVFGEVYQEHLDNFNLLSE